MNMFGGAVGSNPAAAASGAEEQKDDLFNDFLSSPPDLTQAQGNVNAKGLESYAGFDTNVTAVNESATGAANTSN